MDFFEYKYQINIDGMVSAYRFPYLLAGNSVVLKQESPYYEHFYGDFTPHHHYIPIARDIHEQNDAVAVKIMRNSRDFVRNNLMPSHIYCYHLKLIEVSFQFDKKVELLFDKLISFQEFSKRMEKVENKSIDCNCK